MGINRKRVVIIGGSFGGINAAYELRRRLGDRVEITVISRERAFTFLPSLPWVIMGWRDAGKLEVPLEEPLSKRGIRFIHGEVTGMDTGRCEVRISETVYPYDILLIATGADLDYAAVPGLGPDGGHTQSTFSIREAILARDSLAGTLAAERGQIVIGATAGASCIGPAYEIAMMIDTVLRRMRKRHRFSISFITPEPFLGHWGVGGIGMSPRMIEDEFAERHIDSIVNAKIVESMPDRLILADGSEHPFQFSLVVPAFLGAPFIRGVKGLANPRGFITVNPDLKSAKFDTVYSAGVAIAIPPPGQTPVPVAVPKTGHMTELMARAAARNIASDLIGGAKVDALSLPSTCIADAGDTAFYLSADPFLPPRNKVTHKKGRWARYLKISFEKYYLARIRHDWPSLHFGW